MSESTAREARRDLRRTVGLGALETLRGQQQSIASVAASLNSLREDLANLAQTYWKFRGLQNERNEMNYASISQLGKDFLTFRHRTFWGRLRWLVTGR